MKKVELLAPAGNYEAFIGAINAGADAVYLGGEKYGARAYADNFTEEEIVSAIHYAHLFGKKVYLTINTIMKEEESNSLYDYLENLYKNGLDAVIVQDLGAITLLKECFPNLEIHASTQMTITSELGVAYLKELGASRVVPARELSLAEIKTIKSEVDIELECFVHGAMCYCYSGQCLFSSILGGRSGNRGRCAQPCRLPYKYEKNGEECYPFSLKDMCTISFLPDLIEAGIDSFKIEGRMKKPEYAAGVTALYRKYIDLYYKKGRAGFKVSQKDLDDLSKLYIRSEIQEGYYFRHNGKEMITPDKPSYVGADDSYLAFIRKTYIENSKKLPIRMWGKFVENEKAKVTVYYNDLQVTCEGNYVACAQNRPMSAEDIKKQLSKVGNTSFACEDILLEVGENIFVPNKSLNELRRQALIKLEEEIISQNGFIPRHKVLKPSNEEKTTSLKNITEPIYIVSVTTKEQWNVLINNREKWSIGRLYLDYSLVLQLSVEELESMRQQYTLGVIFPRIIRKNGINILEKLYVRCQKFPYAIIKNLETLYYLKQQSFEGQILCDYNMYICNSKSVKWAKQEECGFCYPLELNKGELMRIKGQQDMWTEQVIYSYIPLMVTANCIKKTKGICKKDGGVEIVYDRYQNTFFAKSHCSLCYSELYNCVPMSLHKYTRDMKHKIDGFRIDFTMEDEKNVINILEMFFCNNESVELKEYTTGHYKRGVE